MTMFGQNGTLFWATMNRKLPQLVAIFAIVMLSLSISSPAFSAAPSPIVQDCPDCPRLVAVPGGTLVRQGLPDVVLKGFLAGVTEVTFDQWAACVADQACRGGQDDHAWGRGDRPMINVDWNDIQAYLKWLSTKTGRAYRLPSEDEWEWAARAGTKTPYWWGPDIGDGLANCRHCGTPWSGKGSAPVGSFTANPFGLYDTAGNVWEWTSTCWTKIRGTTPPSPCRERVIKGGAWYYIPNQARADARARQIMGSWSYTVGFRVFAPLP